MNLVVEEATRQGVIPLIGIYGQSGSGKTHTALLLARGFAGPTATIGIIDTERKRSGALVGLIPGGFKRINLEQPFEPEVYLDALALAEKSGWTIAVVDSMSHEWEGEGGVLEMQEDELQRMAGDDYKRREACKMASWIKPKQRHKGLVKAILRSNIPLICCLRADQKVHMTDKREGEKTKVIMDEFSTPIYDKRFIFEMLVNMETVQVNGKPGCVIPRKWTHPDILKCLPTEGVQLTTDHGAALAKWCGGTTPTAAAPKPSPGIAKLKKELWAALEHVHHGDPKKLEQALWDENCLDTATTLAEVTETELKSILAVAKKKFPKR